MTNSIAPPSVKFDNGAIHSTEFEDIYFQPEDGLAETKHVFLQGNCLAERFAQLSPGRSFIIGELGLGTGLNLLAALQLFIDTATSHSQFHFWTCEARPFSRDAFIDLVMQHAERWPELHRAAEIVAKAYPQPRPGISQRLLSAFGTLTISFGDAEQGLNDSHVMADAWFLDGFSPSKNETMWSPSLLKSVHDHTSATGTASTFTVAGVARRGLADAGFELKRMPGFGRKREMLTAIRHKPSHHQTSPPKTIAIIGAGIAGASAAWWAKRNGITATVFERHAAASGASGNPAGLVMPRIDAGDTPMARFYRDSFLFARSFYKNAVQTAFSEMNGKILISDEKRRLRFNKASKNGIWSDTDFSVSDDLVTIHTAGLLFPTHAIDALLSGVKVVNANILAIEPDGQSTVIIDSQGSARYFDAAVVCAGAGIASLWPAIAPEVSGSRGQVNIFEAGHCPGIISNGTYVAPLNRKIIAGATYDRVDLTATVEPNTISTEKNIKTLTELTGLPSNGPGVARASIRTVTTDKHPVCGRIFHTKSSDEAPRAWGILGLGSRGLSTGPLLAAHVMSELAGTPSPLAVSNKGIVDSCRFEERRLRRSQQ